MDKLQITQNAKDIIFRNLFADTRNIFLLYTSLFPEDIDSNEQDIRKINFKSISNDSINNTLYFYVRDKLLIRVEPQSILSKNVLVRSFFDIVDIYCQYYKDNEINLYGSKTIALPEPKLYIIYTGERNNNPDSISLKNDFFKNNTACINTRIKIIYKNNSKSIINQYILFCMIFDDQIEKYGYTNESIIETVKICKKSDILKEYLQTCENEVITMVSNLFAQERDK